MSWRITSHVETGWRSECRQAVAAKLVNFRQLPNITYVTENYHAHHVKPLWERAVKLLPRLTTLLPQLSRADTVGGPAVADVTQVDGYPLSGCAAHSAFRAAQILHVHGDRSFHIAEIGGGYGSLAMVLHFLGAVKSYTGFDLPEPSQLQRCYLDTFGFPFNTWYELGKDVRSEWDLVISCASLSELTPIAKDHYAKTVLSRSQNGFHVWNWTREDWEVEKIIADDLLWFNRNVPTPGGVQYCPNLGWDAMTWDGVFVWKNI